MWNRMGFFSANRDWVTHTHSSGDEIPSLMKYKGGIFDEREGSFHPVISAASGQTVSTLLLLLLVHYFFFSSPVSYNFLETTSTKQHASTPACVLLCVEVVRQKIPSIPPSFLERSSSQQPDAIGCSIVVSPVVSTAGTHFARSLSFIFIFQQLLNDMSKYFYLKVPIELIRRSFSPPEISVILYQIISPSGWEIPELVVTSSAFSPYWEFRLQVSFLDEPAGPLFLFYFKKEEESLYWYLVALPFAFFSCWCSYTHSWNEPLSLAGKFISMPRRRLNDHTE